MEQLRHPKEIGAFKKSVSHIKTVDARSQSWQGNLPALFDIFGFKQTGAGKYGTVFIHPRYPYVVKVFMRDTAYLKWLEFCKHNQSNKFVPKIKGKVIKIGNVFMAVRLEKLTPVTHQPTDYPSSILYDAADAGDEDAIKVADFFDMNAKLLDLHWGNVMMRGKQYVFVDPFYLWYKNGTFVMDPDDLSEFRSIL